MDSSAPRPDEQRVSVQAEAGDGQVAAEAEERLSMSGRQDLGAVGKLGTGSEVSARPDRPAACPAPVACSRPLPTEVVRWTAETGAVTLNKSVDELSRREDFAYLGRPSGSEYSSAGVYRTDFEHGALIRVPELNRIMTLEANVAGSAVVIGDSQAGPGSWMDLGLAGLGYRTYLRGAGGTGYIAGNGTVGNYYTALTTQQWLLPWGNPKLVVLQGGGNDAGRGTDAEIAAEAARMIGEVRRTYPHSRLVMIGVISSGSDAFGSQRTAVDSLLGEVASKHGVEFLSVGNWWSRFGLGGYLEPDGRHFTAAGQKAAAAVLARELGALLAAGPGNTGAGS
ncbi:SGNH/GDSL hydrolase family protein [Arthrobacter sp. NPDC097144]|uniref:SGNH/GDSL hydrolase family protein n=1 Tax=Arthrobacter sp. NPDC097144 TaxID=3363946 RepID=UPI0037FDF951